MKDPERISKIPDVFDVEKRKQYFSFFFLRMFVRYGPSHALSRWILISDS